MTQFLRRPQPFRQIALGLALSVGVVSLGACRQAPESVAAPAASVPAKTPAVTVAVAPDAPPAFMAGLKQDMPYARLREAVLAAGWAPLRDPACWDNVGGTAAVCGVLPETESCSGDGACLLWFVDPADGRRLRVTTYGPYERWNVAGEEAAFAVRSWELSAVTPSPARSACPGKNFDEFLKRFSADESIERAFTAPFVKVARIYEDDNGYQTSVEYESGATYRGFILDYRDDAWYLEPIDGETPVGTNVRVTKEAGDRYFVTIPGNVEGISYRFEPINGCWQLAADPEDTP